MAELSLESCSRSLDDLTLSDELDANALDRCLPPMDSKLSTKKRFRRVRKNCALFLWFILLLLMLPIFIVYAICTTITRLLSPMLMTVLRYTWKLLANSIYISRLGKSLHYSQIKRTLIEEQSPDTNILYGHSRSLVFATSFAKPNRERVDVEIHSIAVLDDNINYLVVNLDRMVCHERNEAMYNCFLVDCSNPNAVHEFLKHKELEYNGKLNIRAIICSHTHWDHVQGIPQFVTMWKDSHPTHGNIPVIASSRERGNNKFITHSMAKERRSVLLNLASIPLNLIHTPGHTHGSIVIVMKTEDAFAFTGDTLFSGGCGSPFEYHKADFNQTLLYLCGLLPEECRLLPGHDYIEEHMRMSLDVEIDRCFAKGVHPRQDVLVDSSAKNLVTHHWPYSGPATAMTGWYLSHEITVLGQLLQLVNDVHARHEPFIGSTVGMERYLNDDLASMSRCITAVSSIINEVLHLHAISDTESDSSKPKKIQTTRIETNENEDRVNLDPGSTIYFSVPEQDLHNIARIISYGAKSLQERNGVVEKLDHFLRGYNQRSEETKNNQPHKKHLLDRYLGTLGATRSHMLFEGLEDSQFLVDKNVTSSKSSLCKRPMNKLFVHKDVFQNALTNNSLNLLKLSQDDAQLFWQLLLRWCLGDVLVDSKEVSLSNCEGAHHQLVTGVQCSLIEKFIDSVWS